MTFNVPWIAVFVAVVGLQWKECLLAGQSTGLTSAESGEFYFYVISVAIDICEMLTLFISHDL